MIKCLWCTFALIITMMQTSYAGDKPALVHRVSCSVVRFYVAKYSAGAAEAFARSHGATDAEIETARRCLASGTVQAAAY
jgi:hypothetical protein